MHKMLEQVIEVPRHSSRKSGGWHTRELSDICEIERGGSPRPIDSFLTDDPSGINWIKIGDTKGITKYIYQTQEKIKPEGAKRSRLVVEDDFILSNSMSFGRPYIMKTTGCIHDGWLLLRPKEPRINQDFLYYVLGSDLIFRQFDSLAAGSTVRNLNIALVKTVRIPVPPLKDQERIVGLLNEISEDIARVRSNSEIALEKASDLFASYRKQMLSADSPTLRKVTLPDISENLDYKRRPVTRADRLAGKYPYYGASGIVDYVQDYLFEGDALLVSEDGANLIARSTPIAFPAKDKYWVNNHAHILKFSSLTTQQYVELYLESISIEEFVTGAAQPKLNQKQLNSIPIKIPNAIEEQSRTVGAIHALADQCDLLKDAYQKKLAALDEMKQSLLNQAFSGNL